MLGRALYEGVLLDLPLAPFFVSRLQVGVAWTGCWLASCLPACLPVCIYACLPACLPACLLLTPAWFPALLSSCPPCRVGGPCLMSCRH